MGVPPKEIIDIMFKNKQSAHYHGEDSEGDERARTTGTRVIVTGPKKGIVFVTYSGIHFGPPEAVPALGVLELEMEHLFIFKCIGRFSCPGKHGEPREGMWHYDLANRPNERDLLKAEIFMEEILEDLH